MYFGYYKRPQLGAADDAELEHQQAHTSWDLLCASPVPAHTLAMSSCGAVLGTLPEAVCVQLSAVSGPIFFQVQQGQQQQTLDLQPVQPQQPLVSGMDGEHGAGAEWVKLTLNLQCCCLCFLDMAIFSRCI